MDYRLGEVPDAELKSVKINGEPLQADRTYRLATGHLQQPEARLSAASRIR